MCRETNQKGEEKMKTYIEQFVWAVVLLVLMGMLCATINEMSRNENETKLQIAIIESGTKIK